MEAGAALRAQQREYLVGLERQGVLFGAGPLVGADGWGERQDVEMIVVRVADREGAEAIARDDRLTRAGAQRVRVIPWWRNGGTLQLQVRFASRELVIDGRTYQLDPAGPPVSTTDELAGEVVYPCLMQTNPDAWHDDPSLDELKRDHQAYLKGLERTGALVASGPLRDAAGRAEDVGTGMIVLRAESLEAAEKLIGEEPYAKAGARTATVASWTRDLGGLAVGAGLGTGHLRVDARLFGLLSSE